MADYIYLLQTRLTAAQQSALSIIREAARARSTTVFLVGGAVRDMTTGAQIRDLDFAVQGNATKLKKDLQKAGGVLLGEDEPGQALHFSFPGGVRLEVGSTLSATFPKPGKPVYKPATILEDLRRRDFTANAMAISLNDGSFGLLMDPLNGVADLENRELRLVSNYGFIEDPSRLIRAARFSARLGWQMEEKTRQRYDTAKEEGYVSALNSWARSYELEEVFHEEDPLRVMRRLEGEGWAKVLTPVWTSAKANEQELSRLRDTVGQLEAMGIFPDTSAAYFPLLTAKLGPKELSALKSSFARPGFVSQIEALDAETKAFAAQFTSKSAVAPSDAWKMLFHSAPEPVLWLAHTTKSAPLQAKFKAFFTDWSQARNKIPYQLMQEMRIVPTLPGYDALLDQLFFAVMDGKLDTPEAAKAFLEPFSPPAPPPPVNMRRRAVKRETKVAKPRTKKVTEQVAPDVEEAPIETAVPVATGPAARKAAPVPAKAAPAAVKSAAVKAAPAAPVAANTAAAAKPRPSALPAKVAAKKSTGPAAKTIAKKAPARKAAAKKAPVKAATKKAATKQAAPKKAAKKALPAKKKVAPAAAKKPAVKKAPAKTAAKKSPKTATKKAVKPAAKKAAKVVAKTAAKKKKR